MNALKGLALGLGKIVEHREDRMVIGDIEYGGVNGDGSIGIGWQHDGMNRTTLFSVSSWEHRVVRNVVFLRRTGEDTGLFDMPQRGANLYTLILMP